LLLLITLSSCSQESIKDERTGISIIFTANGKIFPYNWYLPDINGKAKPLKKGEYLRSEKIIRSALQKYPADFVHSNLNKVYVLGHLEFYGVEYGGTYSDDNVYLANKGVDLGYSELYLEQTFHEEFSSILLLNYTDFFDLEKWKAVNPENFKYGEGGVNAIKEDNASLEFDPAFNEIGFLYEYGVSDWENDFNSFAGNLFLPPKGFSDLLNTYPLIKKKRDLAIEFFSKCDHSFTKEYFDKLLHDSSAKDHE